MTVRAHVAQGEFSRKPVTGWSLRAQILTISRWPAVARRPKSPQMTFLLGTTVESLKNPQLAISASAATGQMPEIASDDISAIHNCSGHFVVMQCGVPSRQNGYGYFSRSNPKTLAFWRVNSMRTGRAARVVMLFGKLTL